MKRILLSLALIWSAITVQAQVKHPAGTENAAIYEVNIRQYTPEGTIKAFMPHLKRLKSMGIDILWIMPIQPIGVKNRKGDLGSYYSISDYTAVNPEFGDMADVKDMVKQAHDLGMKVILDWVANHSAWDNVWVNEHPDWFVLDSAGNFTVPYDWTDVIKLNYQNKELRKAMLDAMKFWIKEADMDGFRCDVAYEVPMDFWNTARKELDRIKPVFMLAEAEGPQYHTEAFDMTYTWENLHLNNHFAKGEKSVADYHAYWKKEDSSYDASTYRMTFVTNHDENSWAGTVFERYGDKVIPMTVLSYTWYGMPLVYSGQEAGLSRRLSFFGKDSIDWSDLKYQGLIASLLKLRKEEAALWSGTAESRPQLVSTPESPYLVYRRALGNSEVWVVLNFSDKAMELSLSAGNTYEEIIAGSVCGANGISVPAGQARVYRKINK